MAGQAEFCAVPAGLFCWAPSQMVLAETPTQHGRGNVVGAAAIVRLSIFVRASLPRPVPVQPDELPWFGSSYPWP
jgi:hypothetical protein